MTASPTYPILRRFYNYNDNLLNEYFGQIHKWKENWQDMQGQRYIVEHNELGVPLLVELVGVMLINGYEIEKEMDWARFSDFCPVTTIRELCGFDDNNFPKWKFSTGIPSMNGVGLYVFKNINYKKA